MRVILDTHALIWAALSPVSLSGKVRAIIARESNEILVSAASAWEIATKVRLGKLPGAEPLERDFLEAMEDAGYTLLPVDAKCALRAGRFLSDHRDPFDRVIAAHALEDDIPVISIDQKLDSLGVRRIW